jgi:2-dehydropantoate 2-reductase
MEQKVDGKFGPLGATKQQSVAVIGSGAVGLYYGARLAEAGHKLTYLARRDLKQLKEEGLKVESIDGDLFFENPNVVGDTKEIGEVDWVLLCLKSANGSLEKALDMLEPCVGENTRILAIMNGLGIEDTLSTRYNKDKIFGGMAFTNNYRVNGVVKHVNLGSVQVGHHMDDEQELAQVVELFKGSKITMTTVPCLLQSRWEKLCWNIPFNGLAVAMGGITVDKIVGDDDLRAVASTIIKETVQTANLDLEAHGKEARIPDSIEEKMMTLTESIGAYKPSTMCDLVENRPMEVDYLFTKPLERASSFDEVETPAMETLVSMIRGIQRMKGL